jgi:Predicted choloylglycine hydrolase
MREAFWGCLDGMNEDGLAVSLTFGGRKAHGPGIAMPMVLRYVLETCRSTKEAVAKLLAIPVPMAQNVTVLDRSGDVATVFTGCDRPAGRHLAPPLHQSPGGGRLARDGRGQPDAGARGPSRPARRDPGHDAAAAPGRC